MSLDQIVKKVAAVTAVLVDNQEVAGLVGKTLADFFFRKGKFTAEQKADLDAHFDDLSARESRLQDEIDNQG